MDIYLHFAALWKWTVEIKPLACVKSFIWKFAVYSLWTFCHENHSWSTKSKDTNTTSYLHNKLERHQNKACSVHRFHYQAKIYPDNTSLVFYSSMYCTKYFQTRAIRTAVSGCTCSFGCNILENVMTLLFTDQTRSVHNQPQSTTTELCGLSESAVQQVLFLKLYFPLLQCALTDSSQVGELCAQVIQKC